MPALPNPTVEHQRGLILISESTYRSISPWINRALRPLGVEMLGWCTFNPETGKVEFAGAYFAQT